MAVRLITDSPRNGPNSIAQNPDRWDFTGNTENTPLRSASSRMGSNIEQDEIDGTREIDNSEDGDFPAIRFNYDRKAHTHHTSHPACPYILHFHYSCCIIFCLKIIRFCFTQKRGHICPSKVTYKPFFKTTFFYLKDIGSGWLVICKLLFAT